MKTKRINYKLLKRIRSEILLEPLRLEMNEGVVMSDTVAPCNTTACIAGWAVVDSIRSKTKLDWKSAANKLPKDTTYRGDIVAVWNRVQNKARKLLGLTRNQSDRLFYDYNWPFKFQQQFDRLKTRKAKAKVAVARIEHFIKTRGRE